MRSCSEEDSVEKLWCCVWSCERVQSQIEVKQMSEECVASLFRRSASDVRFMLNQHLHLARERNCNSDKL